MLKDDDFLKLLQSLDRPRTGFRKVRKGVQKRLRRHMAALGCSTIDGYLEIIQQHRQERRRCEQALMVTISRFFRDRLLWQLLGRRILPDLIRRFAAPISIWSAGCANGEEAYSLAITWAQLSTRPRLKLLATDAQAHTLDRAKQGIYNRSSLRELTANQQARFFRAHGRQQKIIQKQQLAPIRWREHNLLEPPTGGPFHMILLRNNLMTYYQGPTMMAALRQIIDALVPGGFLVLGAHERLPDTNRLFSRDPSCPCIHQLMPNESPDRNRSDHDPRVHPTAG